jgi:phosphoserine phosphatase
LETAPQAAAFFDMGGSLLRGSATMSLAAAAVKEGFVSKRELALGLASGLSFLRKGASTDRTAQIRDRVLRMVKGRKRADLLSICEGSMSKIVNDVRPAAKELLRAHEDLGNARVAVSAVPTEVVSQVAMELQLDYGIGTTASVDENGRYTHVNAAFLRLNGEDQESYIGKTIGEIWEIGTPTQRQISDRDQVRSGKTVRRQTELKVGGETRESIGMGGASGTLPGTGDT